MGAMPDPTELGIPNFDFSNYQVLDAVLDPLGETDKSMWVLLSGVNDVLELLQIHLDDLTVLREVVLYENQGRCLGGVTATSDGRFHLVHYASDYSDPKYEISEYPVLTENSAIFSFHEVENNLSSSGAKLTALTSQIPTGHQMGEDVVYGIDVDAKLATFDGGNVTLTAITEAVGGSPDALPLAPNLLLGGGFQFSGVRVETGSPDFYHLLLKFYDNKALSGEPDLIIDSRENLEAFLNVDIENDPYIVEDAYFAGARGILLSPGQGAYVYFDASHYRPGNTNASYPYGFEANKTYFMQALAVDSRGNATPVDRVSEFSFSCSKCTRLGDNSFDKGGCSYSFTVENTTTREQYYAFQVLFFADIDMKSLVRRFDIVPDNSDLDYIEFDNLPSAETEFWTSYGLLLKPGDKRLVQVYPALDPSAGFLCGLNYHVRVLAARHVSQTEFAALDFAVSEETNSGPTYFCECSSNIFPDPQIALSQVARWHSSSQGYSDTRVTDTTDDTTAPILKARRSGSVVIAFEKWAANQPAIQAATFRISDQNELRSSGVQSWFDFDPRVSGKNTDVAIDLYDRASLTYQRQTTEPAGTKLGTDSVFAKNCEISFEEATATTGEHPPCDLTELESNVTTNDPFISSRVVKKVLVAKKDVAYFTYNSESEPVAVVTTCNVGLQIWGTPEIVAYRLRNEDQTVFGPWCPWSPELGDNYTEVKHTLSKGVGLKQVCVQAMTYSGVSNEFCVSIVGDYARPSFEFKMYSDAFTTELPTHEGMYVASTPMKVDGRQQTETTVHVEIIPATPIDVDVLYYDILQQGMNDLLSLQAQRNSETGSFRGSFTIRTEDNNANIDGLARIRVSFPGSCERTAITTEGQNFTRDKFNPVYAETTAAIQRSEGDPLADYRQSDTGKMGVGVTIRPTEDPAMVFGDPDYFLKG